MAARRTIILPYEHPKAAIKKMIYMLDMFLWTNTRVRMAVDCIRKQIIKSVFLLVKSLSHPKHALPNMLVVTTQVTTSAARRASKPKVIRQGTRWTNIDEMVN